MGYGPMAHIIRVWMDGYPTTLNASRQWALGQTQLNNGAYKKKEMQSNDSEST